MKFPLLFACIFAAEFLLDTGSSESLSEDDGFRRLLRRASAEADRPLVREQRRNKDEDDEDVFNDFDVPKQENPNIRKKREEDDFYHTLLSRSEQKSKAKRSFDTEDSDHKLQSYVVREDWTGDSKISDADREELESLFSKLNADDGVDKKEKIRSTDDDVQKTPDNEQGAVNDAASSYTSWLMGQPVNKLSAALTHKADVDHTLTKIFFEDKRGRIPSVCENDPACRCKHACKPYTVAHYFPCHCSTHYPGRSKKDHKGYPLGMHTHHAHKRHKDDDSRPGDVRYPDPPHWVVPHKKNFASRMNISKVTPTIVNGTNANLVNTSRSATVVANNTVGNCTTRDCQCKKTCSPGNVASVTPCVCEKDIINATSPSENSDAKNLILQGSKLCTDDTPKCLCTRACFPKAVATFTPCNCEGENISENKTLPAPSNDTAIPADYVRPAVPAKKIVQANFKYTEKSGGLQLNMKLPQACDGNDKDCTCKKMCYPNPVAEALPCKCDVLINVTQPLGGNKTVQPLSISDAQSNMRVNNSQSTLEKLNLALESPIAKVKQTFRGKSITPPVNVNAAFTQMPPIHHDFIDMMEGQKQVLAKGKPPAPKLTNQVKVASQAPVVKPQTVSQPAVAQVAPIATAPAQNVPQQAPSVPQQAPAAPINNAPSTDTTLTGQVNTNAQTDQQPLAQAPAVNSVQTAPLNSMNSNEPLVVNAFQAESYANTPATITNSYIQPLSTAPNAQTSFTIPATQRQNVDLTNTTKADQRTVVDPLARTWCQQACHPLKVAVDNPCKCISSLQKASPARFYNQTNTQAAAPQAKQAIGSLSTPIVQKPNTPVLSGTPAVVSPQMQVSPMFPPRAPEAFPPRAPAAAKIPLMANYQPVASIPETPKVPAASNAGVMPKIANVAGPSAAVVQSAAAFAKPGVPATQNVAARPQISTAQYPGYNYGVPQASMAGVTAPYAANVPNPQSTGTHVTANVRHDVHQTKDQPLDNACIRTCRPNPVLRNRPCTCAVQRNNTVKQSKNDHITASVMPSQQQQMQQQQQQQMLQQQAQTAVQQQVPAVPQAAATGLFGTNAPIYINHPSYQGCFKDRMPIRDLPKRFTRFDTTPEACISECKYQNYKFAGVQYGYLCFCGNAFGRYGRVADNDCNSICNGDIKRNCGAFWHNSVYSVDGKEYDPTDFDFAKVDADERARDSLPVPAPMAQPPPPVVNPNREFIDTQGANLATHLMKAAQAALQAAKKLLPSVSKKHKVHHRGHKRHKEKRSDDEEDAEIMEDKMAAMASLSAAKQIMQKTNFGLDKREAEREKRSVDEDSDPFDPENGKELLKAYLSNVDVYKRQVRSVDDEEEDDDQNEKETFEYRRMTIGDEDDGQFVEKYDDEKTPKDKKVKRSLTEKNRRSTNENIEGKENTVVQVNSTSKNVTMDTKKDNKENVTYDATENSNNSTTSNNATQVSADKSINNATDISANTNATETSNKTSNESQRKDVITNASGDAEEKRSEIDTEQDVKPSIGNFQGDRKKRRSMESEYTKRKSNVYESGSAFQLKSKRFVREAFKRSLKEHISTEGSAVGQKKQKRSVRVSNAYGSAYIRHQKRSLAQGSAFIEKKQKKRSVSTQGSAYIKHQKRSITEGSAFRSKHHRKRSLTSQGSAYVKRQKHSTNQKRSVNEGSAILIKSRKRRSTEFSMSQGSAYVKKQRRSIAEGSATGHNKRKRRSIENPKIQGSAFIKHEKRSLTAGSATGVTKRSTGSLNGQKIKKRSLEESLENAIVGEKKRRELNGKEFPELGASKITTRGADLEKLQASLEKIEKVSKRSDQSDDDDDNDHKDDDSDDDMNNNDDDDDMGGEAESGSGEFDWEDDAMSGSGESEDSHDIDRRDVEENQNNGRLKKRSSEDTPSSATNLTVQTNEDEKAHLRSDVEKGVDSLLNLVVELYKQQKTIKAFESSVRSLRHDILRQLNVPRDQKTSATAKVRDEIEKTARERLHVLTSSIERKITEFAKNHPEASKQANLASTLLPKLPLSDDKYLDSKKEISRRSAEFDNVEDAFSEQTEIPDILREHFKRNSEDDIEFDDTRPKRSIIHGEQNLSRMHRDVQESQYEVSQDDAVDELEKLLY